MVQDNKIEVGARKSKGKKRRRTKVLEEDIDIENFLIIKYLLNHKKYGGVFNGSFWIRMFKQLELSVGPLLPRTIRATLNVVLDPLIPGTKVPHPKADYPNTYRGILL